MSNSDVIEVEGTVTEVVGGGKYLVMIKDMDMQIEAYAAGKMKKHNIRIIPGDAVKIELNPYEPTKGRIVYRSIQR
jgi:translation initiation factor IF-1